MQVTRGDENGYLVPGGIAGSSCLGAYKYGVLHLQVGGWATGRQSTARKSKLWPRKSLSGIDLGSGKGLTIWHER